MLDRRDRAFIDLDLQCNTISRLVDDIGFDAGRVTPLRDVLALQLVTYALERCALENLAFGQARLLETRQQILGLDRLVALDFDGRNGRPLHDTDHQHVAFAAELDVLEETGTEQGPRGLHQALVISRLAHVERQSTEHAACRDPLEAVDPDIGNGEGLSVDFGDHQSGDHRGKQQTFHEVLSYFRPDG